ncbi:suppressor of fused domain protein [Caenimonas sedimenti]|uniref:Suppressor of fused domain protein n=1 Tax=Caenimonas sedimenti TaxID=2596921 RepID=A0A562ZMK5_9BURK|nr:suppressor of fused domain protein [Caenimonas sedimenti]TWO69822.1 suppressor of fused domain protein [Caenimonas sedimenti]
MSELVSPSGNPILRHGEAAQWEAAGGDSSEPRISEHIQAHLGPVDVVFHELVSDAVHIDVHVVRPGPASSFVRLVTSGMSDRPMNVPADAGAPRHLELMVTLPAGWRLTQEDLKDERWYWPIRMLKFLARLPHKYDTWLGFGHTVPNGDPPEPYAPGTGLAGAIILPPITLPEDFQILRVDPAKEIHFMSVIPLYPQEMDLKLRSGTQKLLEKFDKAGFSDLIDPARTNVARKRFGFF